MKVWIAVTGLAVVGLLIPGHLGVPYGEAVFKLTASTGFLATALAAGALRSGYGRAILAGLVCSWAGDAFLLDSGREAMFLGGLVSFLLGHCLYVAACTIWGVDRAGLVRGAAVALPAAVIIGVWILPSVGGGMLGPVIAYTLVISAMVVMAFGAHGRGAPLMLPIGALMFFVSDIAVAAGQFLETGFPHHYWGLPLYFGGQILLAISAGAQPRETGAANGSGEMAQSTP